jgi:hypothetical protein
MQDLKQRMAGYRKKRKACGFRNKERFKDAVLFHLGALDLMPTQAKGCWFSTGKSEAPIINKLDFVNC